MHDFEKNQHCPIISCVPPMCKVSSNLVLSASQYTLLKTTFRVHKATVCPLVSAQLCSFIHFEVPVERISFVFSRLSVLIVVSIRATDAIVLPNLSLLIPGISKSEYLFFVDISALLILVLILVPIAWSTLLTLPA